MNCYSIKIKITKRNSVKKGPNYSNNQDYWMAPYGDELLNIRKTKSLHCLKVFPNSESYLLTCILTSSSKHHFEINHALNLKPLDTKVLFNLNDPLVVLFVKICTFKQNHLGSMWNNQNDGHFEESSAPGPIFGAEQVDKGKQKADNPLLVTVDGESAFSSPIVIIS